MVIKVYISGMSGSKEVKKRQQRVTMILDSKHITYTIIDITEPGQEAEKDFMQKNSEHNGATISDQNPRHPLPPQMFNDAEYCGDYDDFDLANEVDNLEVFLKMEAPKASSEVSEDQQKNGTGDAEQDQQSQVTATEAASTEDGDDENKENKTEEGANEPHITTNTTQKTVDDGEYEPETKKIDEANEDSPSNPVEAELVEENNKNNTDVEGRVQDQAIHDDSGTAKEVEEAQVTDEKRESVESELKVEEPSHEEPDEAAEDAKTSNDNEESKSDYETDDPGSSRDDRLANTGGSTDDVEDDEVKEMHLEPVEAMELENPANPVPQTDEDNAMSESITEEKVKKDDETDELLNHTGIDIPEINTEVVEQASPNTEDRINDAHDESSEVESATNEAEPVAEVESAKDPPENDEIENEQDEGDEEEQSDDSDEPVSVMEVTSKVEDANTTDKQGEQELSLDDQETVDPKEIFSEEPTEDDEAEQRELLEAAAAMGKREDAEEEDDQPLDMTEDVEIAEEDEVSSKLVDTDDPMLAEQEQEE